MVSEIVDAASRNAWFSDTARWFLEGGFTVHRRLLHKELDDVQGRILDLGCGTGMLAGAIPAEKYVGVDLSADCLRAARGRHKRHRFVQADCCALPFEDHSIDAAYVVGVIHHLTQSQASQTVRELSRVLVPNGKLVVCEDIPAQSAWNMIGTLVHHLDQGSFIRTLESYRSIIEERFHVVRASTLRSGFMDYGCFTCYPLAAPPVMPTTSDVPLHVLLPH